MDAMTRPPAKAPWNLYAGGFRTGLSLTGPGRPAMLTRHEGLAASHAAGGMVP
jgi:hypothetical protein